MERRTTCFAGHCDDRNGCCYSVNVPVRTSSFSFGSRDDAVRQRAREIMSKAIRPARDLGIRTIQLAGYDVYYEDHDESTQQRFAEGLAWAVEQAAASQVMLAVEIMDTAFMNSISKWKSGTKCLRHRGSPFTRT
ncbi:hypothetical protein DMI66_14020 [Escherichia coli]|nr:hypothetical protein [Escherichia coli]